MILPLTIHKRVTISAKIAQSLGKEKTIVKKKYFRKWMLYFLLFENVFKNLEEKLSILQR